MEDLRKEAGKARDSYYADCDFKVNAEAEMMDKMWAHEAGEISFEEF